LSKIKVLTLSGRVLGTKQKLQTQKSINTMKTRPEQDAGYSYLSELSPKNKTWDTHKAQADKVKHLYQSTDMERYAERLHDCCSFLGFRWELDENSQDLKLKLNSGRRCCVRNCPICQWRKSLSWIARFKKALPSIVEANSSARYIFLTLTVQNCEIDELRKTLNWMNKAWNKLIKRKTFPAIGFARSTEVTKAVDGRVHPHFHVLLMVSSDYFAGRSYLKQADWTALWKSCLGVEYTPIVNVKAVKNRRKRVQTSNEINMPLDISDDSEAILAISGEISSAIVETFKYAVKPQDLIGTGSEKDKQWLIKLTTQLRHTRAIALGGEFKKYLSEKETENELKEEKEDSDICFGWREHSARYIHIKDW
jgi:plasmid rolling circle replication initiator protein Rep